jgi:hypothetical protein
MKTENWSYQHASVTIGSQQLVGPLRWASAALNVGVLRILSIAGLRPVVASALQLVGGAIQIILRRPLGMRDTSVREEAREELEREAPVAVTSEKEEERWEEKRGEEKRREEKRREEKRREDVIVRENSYCRKR